MIHPGAQRMLSLTRHLTFSNSDSAVQFIRHPGLPKLVLNKPKVLNSLNLQMIKDITQYLPEIDKCKAFWIEGTGGKAFCAGGDVKCLFERDATYEHRQSFFREEFTLDYRIASSKAVEIANWDGIVMGGGIGISINAPFRIATESTMVAMPENKIGFFTDVGSSYFLSKLRSNIGMYIALTAGRLKGEEVYHSGFANYYVAKESVPKIYEELASSLQKTDNARAKITQILGKYNIGTPDKKIKNQQEIDYIFGGESVQEIAERASKASTPFGDSVLKAFKELCPLSIHITFKAIKTVSNLSFKDCYKRDFMLAQFFSQDPNFREGVRALLVDKSNDPKWVHNSWKEVSSQQIQSAFQQKADKQPLQI